MRSKHETQGGDDNQLATAMDPLSHPKIWNVKINKNKNNVCFFGFKISRGIKTF
jgi:hypothetical protein